MSTICCKACGWGNGSVTAEEIEQQKEKHGEYICVRCEKSFNLILESDDELKLKTGFGISETLITENAIYYFESDRPKVCNPSTPFLGFGGSWFIVTRNYKSDYGSVRTAFVTNNLFHEKNIPECYQQRFKERKKVNAKVVPVSKDQLISLKNILNNIPFLEVV